MSVVELKLSHHAYRIVIEPGLLGKLGELVHAVAPHRSAAIIADASLTETYQPTVVASLEQAKYEVLSTSMPAGENHKNLDTMRHLYDALLSSHQERNSPIIALGGGVVGDTAGFVAASYLRGVPFIQCPTTLLAMVDASVGGKVGVNLPQGKNLIGAFHQPHLVVIDTDTLGSLPPRELRGGLAECVKHGIIRDESLFAWLEENVGRILALESEALVELVQRNVQIKATVVMADEKESGQRAHLNFGHTFGHAIEATQKYTDQGSHHHGEAVSLGMVAATHLAVTAGRCDASVLDRLVGLLDQIGLPTSAGNLAPTDQLLGVMRLDKKVSDGQIRLVLPDQMGQVSIVNDQPDSAIEAAWEKVRS